MIALVPCVTALLVNRSGEVLLQQRDYREGLRYAGWWSMLGGRVEADEDPDEAIRRELLEEIERTPLLRRWKVYRRPGTPSIDVLQYVYVGVLDEPVATIPLNEGQALRFCNIDMISNLPIAFGFEELCDAWFACYLAQKTVQGSIDALISSQE